MTPPPISPWVLNLAGWAAYLSGLAVLVLAALWLQARAFKRLLFEFGVWRVFARFYLRGDGKRLAKLAATPLGTRALDAHAADRGAMAELFDHIDEQLGIECEDVTVDDYDKSIEFKGCPEYAKLSEEQWAGVKALGFDRCWACRVDGSEVVYGPKGSFVKPPPSTTAVSE